MVLKDPRSRMVFLVLKLLTLVFLVSCFYLGPGLSSAPAAPPSPVMIGLAVGALALVFLGLERFAPPALNKGLTVLAFCVTLIGPGVFVGMSVSTRIERSGHAQEHEALLEQLTAPGQTQALARYLLSPEDYQTQVEGVSRRDLERIEQALLPLPPQELSQHHVAESLLLGIQLETDPRRQTPSPEGLCRLYVKVRERSGFSPARAPFYLRYRDRVVSRIAELGHPAWREEIGRESGAFQDVVYVLFSESLFNERVPQPLAPGEHLVSRSLGSLPLYTVMTLNLEHFPRPPGLEPPSPNPEYDVYKRLKDYQDTREALAVMKSRGVDFTEEELRDPELQAFLETVRTAPAPTTP